jgi:hypothetical protein
MVVHGAAVWCSESGSIFLNKLECDIWHIGSRLRVHSYAHTIIIILYAAYRIARSYGDVYYVVAGVLWEMGGEDGAVWVLVPVGDGALGLR